jgi:tetratricopeptide (TPR) repeat protein
MNKPIVQLVVFLFIVVFATFVLIRFDSFYKNRDLQADDSKKMLLMQKKPTLMNLGNQQAITERNSEINLYRFIGRIKTDLARGRYDKAENDLRNLLLFYPNNRTVLSLLGGVLYSGGNYRQAHDMFVIILKNNPNNSLARESMGTVLKKQHKYSEAIEEFLHASLLRPESASMYLHLAGLYSIIGDKKQAIYNFARAYEIIDVNIIPLSFDPAFDNIRDMPTFVNIIHNAENIVRVQNNIYFKEDIRKKINNQNSIFTNFRK